PNRAGPGPRPRAARPSSDAPCNVAGMPLKEGPVGPFPEGADPDEYDRLRRRVLWTMPSGLYILGSRAGDRRNGMTCNWVTQVGFDPKLVGVSVEQEAF